MRENRTYGLTRGRSGTAASLYSTETLCHLISRSHTELGVKSLRGTPWNSVSYNFAELDIKAPRNAVLFSLTESRQTFGYHLLVILH